MTATGGKIVLFSIPPGMTGRRMSDRTENEKWRLCWKQNKKCHRSATCAERTSAEINALNWKNNNRCSAYLREQNTSGLPFSTRF